MIGVQLKKPSTNLMSTKSKLNNVGQCGTSTLNKMLFCSSITNGFKGLKEKSRYLFFQFFRDLSQNIILNILPTSLTTSSAHLRQIHFVRQIF